MYAGALIFLGYEGFELIANASEDARDPDRTLPRAYLIAIGGVIALYVLVAFVAVGNLPPHAIATQSDYALAAAARPFLGQAGFTLIAVAAVVSTCSAINATLYGAAKFTYLMGRDGELPARFGRPVWNRPAGGLLATTAGTLVIVSTVNIEGISLMGSAGFLIIFAAVNLAAARLAGISGRARALALAGVLACAACLAALIAYAAAHIGSGRRPIAPRPGEAHRSGPIEPPAGTVAGPGRRGRAPGETQGLIEDHQRGGDRRFYWLARCWRRWLRPRARRGHARDPRLEVAVVRVLVVNAGPSSLKLRVLDGDDSVTGVIYAGNPGPPLLPDRQPGRCWLMRPGHGPAQPSAAPGCGSSPAAAAKARNAAMTGSCSSGGRAPSRRASSARRRSLTSATRSRPGAVSAIRTSGGRRAAGAGGSGPCAPAGRTSGWPSTG